VLAAVKKLSDKFQREGFKRRNLKVPGYSDRAIKLALNSLASTGYLDCDERRGPQGYSYSLVERPEITGLGIELCPLPDSEKSPANSKEIAGKPGDAQYCPMPDNEGKVVYAGKSGPGYDVYIGNRLARTGHARSFFHNPFYKERDPVERFEEYLDGMLQNSEEWRRELEALWGKTLGCWCPGKRTKKKVLTADRPHVCHGQVLLKALRAMGTNGQNADYPVESAGLQGKRPIAQTGNGKVDNCMHAPEGYDPFNQDPPGVPIPYVCSECWDYQEACYGLPDSEEELERWQAEGTPPEDDPINQPEDFKNLRPSEQHPCSTGLRTTSRPGRRRRKAPTRSSTTSSARPASTSPTGSSKAPCRWQGTTPRPRRAQLALQARQERTGGGEETVSTPMPRRLMCKECVCDRPRLVLTEDPSRPEGRANYAYVRVVRVLLSAASRQWRERRGERLVRVPHSPYWRLEREDS
jgi:hypothetical protein